MKTITSFYRLTDEEQHRLAPKAGAIHGRGHRVRNTLIFVFCGISVFAGIGVYVVGTAFPYRTVEAQSYTDEKTSEKIGIYSGYVNYFGGKPTGDGSVTLPDGTVFSAYRVNLFGKTSYKNSSCNFNNGSSFVGEFGDNLYPNGDGTFVSSSGEERDGNWTWETDFSFDSESYTGMMSDGMRDGYGKSTYVNGNVYEGEFKNNSYNGFGNYTSADEWSYSGEWKDNMSNGYGKCIYADGGIYEGEWVDGQRLGWGKISIANGDTYEGEFANNTYNGTGTYTSADGWIYVGEWVDGKMEGQGKRSYENGTTYEREFKNNSYNGFGNYTSADGWSYSGEWADGKMSGRGQMILANGNAYEGEWEYNESDGDRVFVSDDGYTIKGEYIGENENP